MIHRQATVAATDASSGRYISPAKPGAVNPRRFTASRLVRLETGSSRLAVFASHTVVIASGKGGISAGLATASITGVSSTAVVSRLSAAVVVAAKSPHRTNIAAKLPRAMIAR